MLRQKNREIITSKYSSQQTAIERHVTVAPRNFPEGKRGRILGQNTYIRRTDGIRPAGMAQRSVHSAKASWPTKFLNQNQVKQTKCGYYSTFHSDFRFLGIRLRNISNSWHKFKLSNGKDRCYSYSDLNIQLTRAWREKSVLIASKCRQHCRSPQDALQWPQRKDSPPFVLRDAFNLFRNILTFSFALLGAVCC